MSKLNAILFNFQNNENQHSIVAMLKNYLPFFIMLVLLIALIFIVVFSNLV